jgi:hypothetical protein
VNPECKLPTRVLFSGWCISRGKHSSLAKKGTLQPEKRTLLPTLPRKTMLIKPVNFPLSVQRLFFSKTLTHMSKLILALVRDLRHCRLTNSTVSVYACAALSGDHPIFTPDPPSTGLLTENHQSSETSTLGSKATKHLLKEMVQQMVRRKLRRLHSTLVRILSSLRQQSFAMKQRICVLQTERGKE